MRPLALCLLAASTAWAQFTSTAKLVVAPTTVRDSKGRFIDGLDETNLILYDNNVPRPIHVEQQNYPISLVVAVETSANSRPILDKLGSSGILFANLLAADQGETALLSFSDRVTRQVDFTKDPDDLTHALKKLRKEGTGAATLDALEQALVMLSHRPPGRRPIILMISETRDRNSEVRLPEIVQEVQRLNASIYWLTYSTFIAPFTDRKVRTYGDVRDDPETEKDNQIGLGRDKEKDKMPIPDDRVPFDYLTGIVELARLRKPNIANIFTRSTGATAINFFTKNALEQAIHAIGDEVHRQYILTFSPPEGSVAGLFHKIRVEVKGQPDLQVKSREGYWAIQ